MTSEELDVVEEMQRTGGSFVSALGRLATLADDENLRRIQATFPEYWVRYVELARLRKEMGR